MIKCVNAKHKAIDIEGFPIFSMDQREFKKVYKLIIEEIRARPDKTKRVEWWECFDADGNKSDKKRSRLLKSREKVPASIGPMVNRKALKQLCGKYSVPDYMGSLFLNEIRLDPNNKANQERVETAKILGLL